jgi:hypothetical protein
VPGVTAPCLTALTAALTLSSASAQDVRVYVSSRAGDRPALKAPLRFEQAPPRTRPAFHVDDTVTLQKMAGFGASFLEAGMICPKALDLAALRTPEGGLVVQPLNSRPQGAEVRLTWHGQTLRVRLPALSISTCLWKAS